LKFDNQQLSEKLTLKVQELQATTNRLHRVEKRAAQELHQKSTLFEQELHSKNQQLETLKSELQNQRLMSEALKA
jgi:Fe2+ transport system protein B